MAKLYYQGHGSYRIVASNQTVIYIDPFAGDGYDLPADLVLITHEHHDHNDFTKISQNNHCKIIRPKNIFKNGVYGNEALGEIIIQAVPAYNQKHSREESAICLQLTRLKSMLPVILRPLTI